MSKKKLPAKKQKFSATPDCFKTFDKKVIEKVERNFLNDDFMKKILDVLNSLEKGEGHGSLSLFEKIMTFSHECYIHGVSVGMNTAIEIYEEK